MNDSTLGDKLGFVVDDFAQSQANVFWACWRQAEQSYHVR